MPIIVDEVRGTITFTECDITFPYGFVPGTGVGTITITPSGGVGSFPLAIQGNGGLPPDLTFIDIEVEPEDPLPDPNPAVVQTDPGGPGEASAYTITRYFHKGDKGDAAAFNLLDADDIDGSVTDEYVVAKKAGETKVIFVPQLFGDLHWPGSISAKTFNNSTPGLLATISVAAKPFAWRPIMFGQCTVAGSVDTRVDLVARLDDQDDGDVVGYCYGVAGVTPPPLGFQTGPVDMSSGAGYGVVAANAAANIYVRVEQKASSSNSWGVVNTTATFSLAVMAVAS